MKLPFSKPKEKPQAEPLKPADPGRGDLFEIKTPQVQEKQGESALLHIVRTALEAKAETTWYSHHNQTTKEKPQPDEKMLAREIFVKIGDVIKRIPRELLSDASHDPLREIRIKGRDLAVNLGQRKPSVPLSWVAKICPELFSREITPERDGEVYFPWHCVVEQLSDCGGVAQPGRAAERAGAQAPLETADGAVVSGPAPVTIETLSRERDEAIRQRDAAQAEVERLKAELRQTSEALEAVCNSGVKEQHAG